MNVFEQAMKMEMDGKAYYEEHAARTDNPQLKGILLELANDEKKHFEIFRAMRDGGAVNVGEAKQTVIFKQVKNIFEELKANDDKAAFPSSFRDVCINAREVEAKAEKFYREKMAETDDESYKEMLTMIADEEHRHWVALEHVIRYLDRPDQWLEDAEWNNLEDY